MFTSGSTWTCSSFVLANLRYCTAWKQVQDTTMLDAGCIKCSFYHTPSRPLIYLVRSTGSRYSPRIHNPRYRSDMRHDPKLSLYRCLQSLLQVWFVPPLSAILDIKRSDLELHPRLGMGAGLYYPSTSYSCATLSTVDSQVQLAQPNALSYCRLQRMRNVACTYMGCSSCGSRM